MLQVEDSRSRGLGVGPHRALNMKTRHTCGRKMAEPGLLEPAAEA